MMVVIGPLSVLCGRVGEFSLLVPGDPGDGVGGVVLDVVAGVVDAGQGGDPVVLQEGGVAEAAGVADGGGFVEDGQAALVDDVLPLAGVALLDGVGGEDVVDVGEVHGGEVVFLGVAQEGLVPVLGAEAEVDDAGLGALGEVGPGVVVLPEGLDLAGALGVGADRGVVEVVPALVGEAGVLDVAVALDDLAP